MGGIIPAVTIALTAAASAAVLAEKVSAVKPPPVTPPPPTPDIGKEGLRRRRPVHGTGKTILTGSLEPTTAQVKKKVLGAERRTV